MFLTKLIITFGLLTITIADQSLDDQLPTDLVDDLRKIALRIVSDQANIFKFTQQLKELSVGAKHVNERANQLGALDVYMMAPESNQIGGNPLVTIQSRINAFFDSMNQLFDNLRHVLERFPVPEDTELDPLKALQNLEQQFQSMLAGLRVENSTNGNLVPTEQQIKP